MLDTNVLISMFLFPSKIMNHLKQVLCEEHHAILNDVDIFISGDSDFGAVAVDRPEVMTPSGFLEKYA